MYEIAGNSVPLPKEFRLKKSKGKSIKNGDHFYIGELPEENLVIALVADGVTNRPCDWMASKLCCEKFMEKFEKGSGEDMIERIKDSIYYTNDIILKTEGEAKGMVACFCVFVWNHNENSCYIFGLGDSRIYKCQGAEVEPKKRIAQMTVDNSQSQPPKDGFDKFGNRRTITVSKVTDAMGMNTKNILVEKVDFLPGELMLLASDGYYEARKSSFYIDLFKMQESDDLKVAFDKVFTKYQRTQTDDLTGVVIRNNNPA